MPNYTTVVKVKAELPSGEPKNPSTGITYTLSEWNAVIATLISENSQMIDDEVGGNYAFSYETNTQKFPEIDGSPSTPGIIEKICRYLCACDALAYFSGTYTEDDNSPRLRRRRWAEDKLKSILKGDLKISVNGVCLYNISVGGIYIEEDEDDRPIMNKTEMDALL